MSARAKDAIDEWIAGVMATGLSAEDRTEADGLRDHAVTDLENEGISEEEFDAAVGGDFSGYLLRTLHPDWDEEAGRPNRHDDLK
mgnify:CR=1 FL=1